MDRTAPAKPIHKSLADSIKNLMRQKPFESITVEEICANAGISRRSFYRHFQDKHDLLNWIFEYDFFCHLEYHDDWNIWDYFYVICEFLYQDRKFYANAFTSGQNSSREFCDRQLNSILHKDFLGTFKNQEEESYWMDIILSMGYDTLVMWLRSDECLTPNEFVEQVRDSHRRAAARYADICNRVLADNCQEIAYKMKKILK